jgi:hypothetical protein
VHSKRLNLLMEKKLNRFLADNGVRSGITSSRLRLGLYLWFELL